MRHQRFRRQIRELVARTYRACLDVRGAAVNFTNRVRVNGAMIPASLAVDTALMERPRASWLCAFRLNMRHRRPRRNDRRWCAFWWVAFGDSGEKLCVLLAEIAKLPGTARLIAERTTKQTAVRHC
jgi:hypothetical protein